LPFDVQAIPARRDILADLAAASIAQQPAIAARRCPRPHARHKVSCQQHTIEMEGKTMRYRWNDAPVAGAHAVKVSGGAEEMEFDQARRRIRLRGRDQETGENFGAELYLPTGGPSDRRTGDAALRNLVERDIHDECAGLAAWQRALNRHYGQ
jgi:hypothetical protein